MYIKPYRYTGEELYYADVTDLKKDISCPERENRPEKEWKQYLQNLREKLAKMLESKKLLDKTLESKRS